MARGPKKAGKQGISARYVSRAQALRKLQLSLSAFRRLCILKGIHPQHPESHKNLSRDKVYYHVKDIQYLAADPIIGVIRNLKTHSRKMASVKGRKAGKATRLAVAAARPRIPMDQVLRDRYPTYNAALADMDDALSMLALISYHSVHHRHQVLSSKRIGRAGRLVQEFHMYVARMGCLESAFASVRGYYYAATIDGERITWLVPHKFTTRSAEQVDYQLVVSFVDVYEHLVSFVLYRLYSSIGLKYPPKFKSTGRIDMDALTETLKRYKHHGTGAISGTLLRVAEEEDAEGTTNGGSALSQKPIHLDLEKIVKSKQIDEADQLEQAAEDDEELADAEVPSSAASPAGEVFRSFVFRIGREVPREAMEFVLLCGGGLVLPPDAPETGVETHLITDRIVPVSTSSKVIRVQPQWILDSFNNRIMLPAVDYAPGRALPPHLSPFVNDAAAGYIPDYRKRLDALVARLRKQQGEKAQLIAKDDDSIWAAVEDESDGEGMESSDESSASEQAPAVAAEDDDEKDDLVVEVGGGSTGAAESALAGEKVDPEAERTRLAAVMLSRKKQRLLRKVSKVKQHQVNRVASLERKRAAAEAAKKAARKSNKVKKSK